MFKQDLNRKIKKLKKRVKYDEILLKEAWAQIESLKKERDYFKKRFEHVELRVFTMNGLTNYLH